MTNRMEVSKAVSIIVFAVLLAVAVGLFIIAADKSADDYYRDQCLERGYTSNLPYLGKTWCVKIQDGNLFGELVEIKEE